jgi:hypothetical protein
LSSRIESVEQYMQSIVGGGLAKYGKGEWLTIVRAKLQDME